MNLGSAIYKTAIECSRLKKLIAEMLKERATLRARIAELENTPVGMTMKLSERLALASEVLGKAAAKCPPIGELHECRLRMLEAIDLLNRFPSFGTIEAVRILRGEVSK